MVDRAPRVLLVVENLSVPFDRRVWQEAVALRRAGYDVVVVCPRGPGRDQSPRDRMDGIEIRRFASRAAGDSIGGYVREYGSALVRIAFHALTAAGRRGFDVVHLANPPDVLFLAVLPLKLRGARIVFDQHDATVELYLSRFGATKNVVFRVLQLAERASLAIADVVLSTNESYRQIAIRRCGKEPEAVFVVRNAPDPDRFPKVDGDGTDLRGGKPYLIAYVGLMGDHDGIDVALQALARLRERRDDWCAVFLGDGQVRRPMEALARTLKLADVVRFPGRGDDRAIAQLLTAADVCIAPEPHSPHNDISTMVKVTEYLAFARPVVAFDLRETIATAGEAAVYAEDDDAGSFAALIASLLDDPERRSAMGRVGRERIEGPLSWETSTRSLLAAYERVVTGARSRSAERLPVQKDSE